MKITRKQIEEWNKKCRNGFKVNERQAIMWGQKRLYKYIRLSPEYLLEVSILTWNTRLDYKKIENEKISTTFSNYLMRMTD